MKLSRITKFTNIVLALLYVPFSIYCFLLQMASESTLGAVNQLYITLIETFSLVTAFIPVFCIIGIVLSVILRKKGCFKLSFAVQFLPVIIFALNMVLLSVAESIVK